MADHSGQEGKMAEGEEWPRVEGKEAEELVRRVVFGTLRRKGVPPAWQAKQRDAAEKLVAEIVEKAKWFFPTPSSPVSRDRRFHAFVSNRGGKLGNKVVAEAFGEIMAELHVNVFVDKRSESIGPGKLLREEIRTGLYGCRSAVLLLCPDFWESAWCVRELVALLDRRLRGEIEVLTVLCGEGASASRNWQVQALGLNAEKMPYLQADNTSVGTFVLRELVHTAFPFVNNNLKVTHKQVIEAAERAICDRRSGDHEWVAELRDALQPDYPTSPADGPFNLDPPQDDLVGRAKDLAVLGRALTAPAPDRAAPPRRVVLTGPPGSGKTSLACLVANSKVDEYAAVAWLSAETPQVLVSHLADFGNHLGLRFSKADGVEDRAKRTVAKIARGEHGRVLLVLDNVERFDDVAAWLPRGNWYDALFTTQIKAAGWPKDIKAHTPTQLSPGDAVALFRAHGLGPALDDEPPSGEEFKQLEELARLLEFSPQCLVEAAGVWEGVGADEVLHEVKDALGGDTNSGGLDPAYVIFDKAIERLGVGARRVLAVLAMMGADKVPRKVLLRSGVLGAVPGRSANTVLQAALVELQNAYHVKLAPGVISMHRLVQKRARERSAELGVLPAEALRLATCGLLGHINDMPEGKFSRRKHSTWAHMAQVVHHAVTVAGREGWLFQPKVDDDNRHPASLSSLCMQIGMYRRDCEPQLDVALQAYNRCLKVADAMGNQRLRASTLHCLARVRQMQGAFAEARSLYEKSFVARQKLRPVGMDRLELATSLQARAEVIAELGEYKKAAEVFEDAVTRKKEIVDELESADSVNHKDLTEARMSLAVTMMIAADHDVVRGQPGLAIKAYEEAQRLLDLAPAKTNHKMRTATIQCGLGRARLAVGYANAAALETLREGVHGLEATQGPEHRSTAAARRDLAAAILRCEGDKPDPARVEEALQLARAALEAQLKTYGDHPHPDVAVTQRVMGTALSLQGKSSDALRLLNDAVRVLKGPHKGRRHELATALHERGLAQQRILPKSSQARDDLAEAERLRSELLGLPASGQ